MGKINFILGEAGSGKSYKMTEKIRAAVGKGRAVTVIVPEQFSSDAERKFYNALGISDFNKIKVETFSRIRRSLSALDGGLGGVIPTDAAKAAIMYTVWRELSGQEMEYYKNRVHRSAFVSECMRITRELEMNGIGYTDLRTDMTADSTLRKKISDIRTISGDYDAKLAECGYLNALSNGRAIAEKARSSDYFSGCSIFIDQFKSFTADEKELIQVMSDKADELFICMTTPYFTSDDEADRTNAPVFATVNETVIDLCGGDTDSAVFESADGINGRFAAAPDIKALSECILRGENRSAADCGNIITAEAPDVYSEADYVCTKISRMVRNGEYRYNDIAVLARNFDDIRPILCDAFEKYEIPYFDDTPVTASKKPIMIFVSALLEAAAKYPEPPTELILRIFKTSLTRVKERHISEFERYCTEKGRKKIRYTPPSAKYRYSDLLKYESAAAENDVTALKAMTELAELQKNEKFRADLICGELLAPLGRFCRSCEKKNSLRTICGALCTLLEELGTADIINRASAARRMQGMQAEDAAAADDDVRQVWKCLGDIITSLSETSLPESDDSFTVKEFGEIFGMVLSERKLARPQKYLNSVTAASSDRARLDSPKVVFVMSAESGLFPMKVSESGIFSEREMEILESRLSQRFAARITRVACEESFIAYNAVSSPSEKLFITYSLSDLKGKAVYPAPLTDDICRMTGRDASAPAAEFFSETLVTNMGSAYSRFIQTTFSEKPNGGNVLTPPMAAAAAKVCGSGNGSGLEERMRRAAEFYDRIRSGRELFRHRIDPQNSVNLYTHGGRLNVSASRLEDHVKCPFMFFCKKGLRLYPAKEPGYDSRVRGNLTHFVLFGLMTETAEKAGKAGISFNEEFSSMSDGYIESRIKALTDKYYADEFESSGIELQPSFRINLTEQSKTIYRLALHLREELSPENSKFEPQAFEYSIGRAENNSWELETGLADGRRIIVSFTGSVDRIDVFEDSSSGKPVKYVRVLDYKTGNKEFRLEDLMNGINMQMMLYLFAVTDKTDKDDAEDTQTYRFNAVFSGYHPAGVLYIPSRMAGSKSGERFRGDTEEELAAQENESFRMNGLTLDDVNVIRAMEYSPTGKYISQTLNTDAAEKYYRDKFAAVRKIYKGKKTEDFQSRLNNIETAAYGAASDESIVLICRMLSSSGKQREKYRNELLEISADKTQGFADNVDDLINMYDSAIKPLKTAAKLCSAIDGLPAARDAYIDFAAVSDAADIDEVRAELNEKFRSPKKKNASAGAAVTEDEMEKLGNFVKDKLCGISREICGGNADMLPLKNYASCEYCDYRSICENSFPTQSTMRSGYGKKEAKALLGGMLGRSEQKEKKG